jgi:fermentation-respiration switch protein FrsA (DUF1100 family)
MTLRTLLLAATRIILLLLAFSYLGILTIIYTNQISLTFPADTSPDNAAAANLPGLTTITVHTADGLALTAWFKPPEPGKPTLLYLHGNAGNLIGRIARVRRFAQPGWGELFLEYRGYGGNPGTPSEDGLNQDAVSALAYLATQNISSTRVILYGESLGTGVAVRLATEKPVAAVILDSPYTSIADVAQDRYWYLPAKALIKNRFELLARIDAIHAPLLVMQGDQDNVVPPAMGRKVYAAANPPKQFWAGPATTHFNVAESGGGDVAVAFVARYVPGG